MSATMLTATIAHTELAASGTNDKGDWQRHALILAPANADLSGEVSVITADTFQTPPAVGETVRVVIENRRRIVGQQVYDNRIAVRFIPVP